MVVRLSARLLVITLPIIVCDSVEGGFLCELSLPGTLPQSSVSVKLQLPPLTAALSTPNHSSAIIMAIHPILDPAPATTSGTEQTLNVEAWTEQATQALRTINLATTPYPRVSRPASVSIPLDDSSKPASTSIGRDDDLRRSGQLNDSGPHHTVRRRHSPVRRDSLKRREALLKGREGSRQRRRWENGKPHHALHLAQFSLSEENPKPDQYTHGRTDGWMI